MLQVEVLTSKSAGGGAVAIHRYVAASSCMGVEVWQGPGLLGAALEQQLTSLVSAITTSYAYQLTCWLRACTTYTQMGCA